MADNQYDVIVVGSGAGGLGASMTLAKAGIRTLLLEKHSKVGGYITSFSRKGFSFDPGAAILSGRMIKMPLDMVEMTEKVKLELNPIKGPGLRLLSPSIDIKGHAGMTTAQMVEQLPGLKPGEASEIEAKLEASKMLGLDPEMQNKPMLDWLKENFTHPGPSLILGMLSFLALIVPPSKVPATLSGITGLLSMDISYPKGGILAIANAYAEAFKLLRGDLRTRTTVSKILVKNQKVEGVELKNGERIQSKMVISDAGLGNTVKLVGEDLFEKELLNKLAKLKPTLSSFSVFLGLDYVPDVFPHTVSVTARNVDEIESLYEHLESGKFFESEKDPIPLYIHTPSLEDPGLAPPGQTSMTIFVWAPYKLAEGDWKDKKEYYIDRIVKATEDRVLPGLSGHIIHKEAATPLTYERYVAKQGGSVLGLALGIGQEPVTSDVLPIEGLYCVGDTLPGALGVPGSIMSGVKCAKGIVDSASAG